MWETYEAPVKRETLRQWIEDIYRPYIDVWQSSGILRLYHDEDIFPEIDILFCGSPENFCSTAEIAGMFDHRTHAFHFVSGQLASIVDRFSETELHTGDETSESIYAEIRQYAQKAIEEWGYQYSQSWKEDYAGFYQDAQSALSAMMKYAGLLASRGEQSAVLDIRDLAEEMFYFWRDPIYTIYEKGYEKIERQYLKQFDQAVISAQEQAAVFSGEDAKALFQGLALHAAECVDNKNYFSVWKCCRLAKRLGKDYPQGKELFRGNFTPNYDEPFHNPDSPNELREQDGQTRGIKFE